MTRTVETESLLDKEFALYIPRSVIEARVGEMATQFVQDFRGRRVRLVCVERGARVFCKMFTDAVRGKSKPLANDTDSLRVQSYHGTASGRLEWKTPLSKPTSKDVDLVVIEDIADTGRTLKLLKDELSTKFASFTTVAMLDKKDMRQVPFDVNYSGLVIPDVFVVGMGLDYDQAGRDLNNIYGLYKPGETAYPFPTYSKGEYRAPSLPS